MKRLVHAVLRVDRDEGRELVLPTGLACLISGDLAVAFREVTVEALTPTLPRLQAFAKAVADLHRDYTTIPFRFGCTVAADSQLEALLLDHRPAWQLMLDRVERCDEYSVHWPTHPESASHQGQPEQTSDNLPGNEPTDRPGTQYLMARRNTLQRTSAVRKQALARAEAARQTLDGLYRSYEVIPPIARRESLVTLVFLVPRVSSTAFLSALKTADQSGSGPLFATGPWPPYHFTDSLPELDTSAIMPD